MNERTTPTIALSLPAYIDTNHIIAAAGSDEIGWLGSVKKNGDTYLIEQVFLFRQEVSGGHCEFDAASLGRFYAEMLKADPANKSLLNRILFWGHLHPGDMTEPSGQDDNQMDSFAHNPYFIRGIFTRGGKVVFTFFDYGNKLKIVDCPWELAVPDDDRRATIAQEIREKVTNGPRFFRGRSYVPKI